MPTDREYIDAMKIGYQVKRKGEKEPQYCCLAFKRVLDESKSRRIGILKGALRDNRDGNYQWYVMEKLGFHSVVQLEIFTNKRKEQNANS